MESDDILTDKVDVRRPELLIERIILRAVAESGDIVGECVEPNIDDVILVNGHGDAPLE